MSTYYPGIILLSVLGFIGGLIWYANRAGKRSAEVSNSERDTANANAAANAERRMLAARTNGPRDEDALMDKLNKGDF